MEVNRKYRHLLATACVFQVAVPLGLSQDKYFSNWPAGTSPLEVGKRVDEHFVTSPHQDPAKITYPEVCAWYGALTFAQLSGNQQLTEGLINRFEPLLSPPGSALIRRERHVDHQCLRGHREEK